tara:strand:+ start:82 stop:645 length:564 start_codon:yes stop_codon:yes gene_type:complete
MGSRTGSPTRAASPAHKSPVKKRTPKKKVAKKPAAHPTYKEMIMAAVVALKQRGGSSRQAISKYIAGHYKVGENANVHLKMAMKRALASGMLISAANHPGTYRLNKTAITAAKPKKKKVTAKKPAAKKTKKPKKAVAKKKKSAPKKAKKTAAKKKVSTKAKKPANKSKSKKAPAKKAKRAPAKKAKK